MDMRAHLGNVVYARGRYLGVGFCKGSVRAGWDFFVASNTLLWQ